MNLLQKRLAGMSADRLKGIRRGIEKESLRATADAQLAQTPHPPALGSALKHERITTDFSESQLEMITGVHASVESCLAELARTHQVAWRSIGDELIWAASMPCRLPQDDSRIPLAFYGSSNLARAKRIYRNGLGHRYGRRMQTISGVHYNWSIPDASTEDYFALIRNFRRHAFLLLYLFGASPAASADFAVERSPELQPLGEHTIHAVCATSLRMGRIGYRSAAQSTLAVSYNDLEGYGNALCGALKTPYPEYEAIGLLDADGQYRQLNTSLLQTESEFYGSIRPKRVPRPGERQLQALLARGVEYVEVRCLDLDPFEPAGIAAATLRFLDIFLLHCLLEKSGPESRAEAAANAANYNRTAMQGRLPGLRLDRNGRETGLLDWARELLGQMKTIAATLDRVHGGGSAYAEALDMAEARLADPEQLPSAQVLEAMRRRFGNSHVAFATEYSERARDTLKAQSLSPATREEYRRMAEQSIAAQHALEAEPEEPFETYRRQNWSAARELRAGAEASCC